MSKQAFVISFDTGETDVTKCIRCGKTRLCYLFKTVFDDPKIIGPSFWICPACRDAVQRGELIGDKMPYKDHDKRIEYCRQWRKENKEKQKEYRNNRYVNKRCPVCRKNITVNKQRKIRICKHCGARIHVSKSNGDNMHNGTAHGVRLWVERAWSFGGKNA